MFEQADGGTIFLDEIGDMPYPLQSKLLRVLQEQQIVRLGSGSVLNINVRIITATNCDLPAHTRKSLTEYPWPGNIRELKNAAEYYKLMGTVDCIKSVREPLPKEHITAGCHCGSERPTANSFAEANGREEGGASRQPLTTAELRSYVLSLIAHRRGCGQSSGRVSLMKELRANGYSVSEKRLESVLAELGNDGLTSRARR